MTMPKFQTHTQAEIEAELARLRKLVYQDALTGIGNRRAFDERLTQLVALSDRYRIDVALLVFDIDNFRDINNTHGHPVGDAVIRQIATVLQRELRQVDCLARLGGDEFVALMPHTSRQEAEIAAERARTAVFDSPMLVDGVSVSCGVAAASLPSEIYCLYEQADEALYRAKHRGRNQTAA